MERKLKKWQPLQSLVSILLWCFGESLVCADYQENRPQYPNVPDPTHMQVNPNDYVEVDPNGGNFYGNGNYGQDPYAQVDPNRGNFYGNGNYGQNPYAQVDPNGGIFYGNGNYAPPNWYKSELQELLTKMPSWDDVVHKGGEFAAKWLPYFSKALAAFSNSSNLMSLKAFSVALRGMSTLKLTTLARDEFLRSFDLIDLSEQEKSTEILGKILSAFSDMKEFGGRETSLQLVDRIHIYNTGSLMPWEWTQAILDKRKGSRIQLAESINQEICFLFVKSGWGRGFPNFFPEACYVRYDPIRRCFLEEIVKAGVMTDRPVRKSFGRWRVLSKLEKGEIIFFVMDQDAKRARIILPY